jgi:hypothetical protein
MNRLRERLDRIMTATRSAPSQSGAAARSGQDGWKYADALPGRAAEFGGLSYWRVEEALASAFGSLPRGAMFVDIETGGFAGTPVFLVGTCAADSGPLALTQFLVRDYPDEEAVLRAFAAHAAERPVWITFNGRGFDEPFLRDRMTLYGLTIPSPREHVDLLPAARRRWRGVVPDCRLSTLEQHILGRTRIGDIPGSDVADLFHYFIRTGNPSSIRPVLEHNRLDLLASIELYRRLCNEGA